MPRHGGSPPQVAARYNVALPASGGARITFAKRAEKYVSRARCNGTALTSPLARGLSK